MHCGQGYLRLGRVAPLPEIERLCSRADDVLLGDVQYPGMTFQLCPSAVDVAEQWEDVRTSAGLEAAVAAVRTLKYRKVQGWERDEHFLQYMQIPIFRDCTRKIIEAERVSIFRSMFFNKPAEDPGVSEGGVVINWHQVRPSLISAEAFWPRSWIRGAKGSPKPEPQHPGLPAEGARNAWQDGNPQGGWALTVDARLTIWTALCVRRR